MNDDFIPGQAVIESVTLTSADGKKTEDITTFTTVIELYESVSLPCLTAALTIVDTIGLAESFPIHGVEMVTIRYKPIKPDAKTTVLEMRVHEQKATTIAYNKKMQAYTLKCVDLDFFNSVKLRVEKAYKSTHSEMINDIVTRTMKVSRLAVETTKGKQDLIVPGINPYQAADLIRGKSTSPAFDYAPYYFFRTINQGFIFSTLANLYTKGQKRPVRNFKRLDTYITNLKNDIPSVAIEYNNVLGVTFPKKYNNSGKISVGAFASKTHSFDIVSKEYKTQNFTLNKAKFGQDIRGGYKAFIGDQTNASVHHFIVTDSTKPNTFESETLGAKRSYMASITDDFIAIEVHGDNEISAGDVVSVIVPILNADVTDANKVDSETLSGVYLVTKVKHVILKELRTHFKTELQLVRNSTIYE